jgi:hypothetical protein
MLEFCFLHNDANRPIRSKIAAMTNQTRDAHDSTVSSKDKRKSRKELEAARREYEEKMAILQAEEDGGAGKASVSNMIIPDYRSGRNEKDINVRNVSLSLDNGTPLLSDGELKFSHRRRCKSTNAILCSYEVTQYRLIVFI